uniref:Core shell protein Gag P30 domain-containing protein n=1 Tax=Zonotrichia albicollis TaxID=44394 RepID=A0A8D2Q9T9_ZONAL
MFFTLRNKPEWQKECGVNVAPQDPLVLALERDKKGSKPKERCCDACSIGQQCLKLTRRDSGKEREISLWEYHPFAPGREGPLPRPKEEQGDPSPLKELDRWWKSRFGHSPQRLDNSWEEGTPLKSGIDERKSSPQGLESPQGSGSYTDADSPPRLEVEGEEGSTPGAESRRETRSLPELSPYGDNNTSRSGGVCRMETSTPRTGDKSNSLGIDVSKLRGDVSELRYNEKNDETCEREVENNSQKLNIIIRIEDKRDGRGAEDEGDSSPGQEKSWQIQKGQQMQDENRMDCVVKIGGEEQEGGKRKEKRKNREDIEAQEEDPGEGTSHSYYTRSVARGETKQREEGNHTIAPLRQLMPMVGERTRVKVPFSTSDLNNWRDEAKNFRRNPEGVAKRFELMAKNLDIDWEDIEVMLSELTDTERELVLETGRRHAQVLSGRLEDNFPSSKPEWDPSNAEHYQRLVQYRKLIAMGLRNAIPKAINWSMLYDIRQEKDETPSEFLDRLRAAMRQYTPLDPATEEGKQHLLGLMMG